MPSARLRAVPADELRRFRHPPDGDNDGRVSLFEPADAAASCAALPRQLTAGSRASLPPEKRRQIIWHYNRSDAYIDTVLTLSRRIEDSEAASAATPDAPR